MFRSKCFIVLSVETHTHTFTPHQTSIRSSVPTQAIIVSLLVNLLINTSLLVIGSYTLSVQQVRSLALCNTSLMINKALRV